MKDLINSRNKINYVLKLMLAVVDIIPHHFFTGKTIEIAFNTNGMNYQGCPGIVSPLLNKGVGKRRCNVSVKNNNCAIY